MRPVLLALVAFSCLLVSIAQARYPYGAYYRAPVAPIYPTYRYNYSYMTMPNYFGGGGQIGFYNYNVQPTYNFPGYGYPSYNYPSYGYGYSYSYGW